MNVVDLAKGWLKYSKSDLVTAKHMFENVYPAENSFSAILDNCSKLNPYGVTVRYPNELAVDEAEAENALEMAQQIYDFCYHKIMVNFTEELERKP